MLKELLMACWDGRISEVQSLLPKVFDLRPMRRIKNEFLQVLACIACCRQNSLLLSSILSLTDDISSFFSGPRADDNLTILDSCALTKPKPEIWEILFQHG
jgi:hypothetical protein